MSRRKQSAGARTLSSASERVPHEVRAFLRALHRATRGLIDAGATLVEREEMYAVLEEKSFTCAYTFLCIGIARHVFHLTIDSAETATQILITLRGTRRVPGTPLTAYDVLPKEETLSALLMHSLHRNRMEYVLEESEDSVTLTLAVPRFLTKTYGVCAVNDESVLACVYAVMATGTGKPAPLS